MYPAGSGQAMEKIYEKLHAVHNTASGKENILLGVSGCVASGKSRFSSKFLNDIEAIFGRNTIYLPFDLWINGLGSKSTSYAGRFLLDDFIHGIRCIRKAEAFMVPRHDIVKKHGKQRAIDQYSLQQLVWNRKGFVKCLIDFDDQKLSGSEGLYVDMESGHVYSFFPSARRMTYLIDGTLIFPTETANDYHCKIFVEASWPLRVARMIRRFNRKETFGSSTQLMHEYITFLVDEAKSCADKEIYRQLAKDMVVIQSLPETLSNYLDLVYLRERVKTSDTTHWVGIEEAETARKEFLDYLRNERNPKILKQLREELSALIESKHLLMLSNVDDILAELVSIITLQTSNITQR